MNEKWTNNEIYQIIIDGEERVLGQKYKSDLDLLDLYANFLLDDYKIQQLYNGNYLINEGETNG